MNTSEQQQKSGSNVPHYNSRSIEAIDFVRHLDFGLGNAFKYIWREGLKDVEEREQVKRNFYIRDALVHRPAKLSTELGERLTRMLSSIALEFENDVFELLLAIIFAATGDYGLLSDRARGLKVFPESVEPLVFGA